jgi:hypothetical protein
MSKKLLRLRLRRAGHAGELVVKAEIILDRDRRQRLRLPLDRDAFLRFDGLVQAIAPAAATHEAAGVFVDDDDLVVLHDVLHVLQVKRVGLEQLRDRMDALRLRLELLLQLRLHLHPFADIRLRTRVDLMQRRREVGQHEGVGVFRAQEIAAFLREVGLVALFVDREQQLFLLGVELGFLLVGVQVKLRLVHQPDVLRILQDLHQLLERGCPS